MEILNVNLNDMTAKIRIDGVNKIVPLKVIPGGYQFDGIACVDGVYDDQALLGYAAIGIVTKEDEERLDLKEGQYYIRHIWTDRSSRKCRAIGWFTAVKEQHKSRRIIVRK
jgi:hypothetical protein